MRQLNIKDYYMGIRGLLKEEVKIDYSPDEVKEVYKCKNDIHYFLKTYVKVIDVDKGKVPFVLRDYQSDFIDVINNNDRIIGLQSRQSGKTIGTCGYILHYIIFNQYKNVAILANKGRTARGILTKIKNMYKSLPVWLQQGVSEWNKGSITLGNHTRIEAAATTDDSIRGDACALLYIDETAFIDNNKWESFWASTYPTISSSKEAKIIMSSTPKGMNHFYKLYTDGENKKNGFVTYTVLWDKVPGRDEAWKDKTIAEIGLQKFQQEFECMFLGSAGTLISGTKLQNLVFIDPEEKTYDNKFSIYEYPDEKRKYVLFADFGEGNSGDYTTAQVIDVTELPWKQVAVYRDNELLYKEASALLNKLGNYYNNCLIIGEANTIGLAILDSLNDDFEYENLFYGDILENNRNVDYFGIKMTKRSKRIGNSYLKEYIEADSLVICDFNTIGELSSYIKVKNSYEAEEGKTDDLVTPLALFSYFMQNKELVEDWLDSDTYNKREKTLQAIEDNLLPIGFFCDGSGLHNMEDDEEWDGEYF